MSYSIIDSPAFDSTRAIGYPKLLRYTVRESDGRKYSVVRNCGPIIKYATSECFFNPHVAANCAHASESRDRGMDMSSFGEGSYDYGSLYSKVEIIPPPSPHLVEIQQLQSRIIALGSQLRAGDEANSDLRAQNEALRQQMSAIQAQMSLIISAMGLQ